MKLERVWWCPSDGTEVVTDASANYPGNCPSCVYRLHDLGYRVGNGRWDWSYYSTLDAARKDRRIR